MTTAARLLLVALRICGLGALALGLAFWVGYGWSFLRLHIALGIGVVLALWALAGIASTRAPGKKGLIALAVIWGLGTWVLGLTQGRILVGPLHWLVEVAHLAAGAIAIGLGGQLAGAIGRVPMAPNRE